MTKQPENKKGDDQFLRRAFDFLYSVNMDDVRRVVNRIDRRTRWLIVALVASLIALWAFLRLAQVGINAIEEANQPSLEDRLIAPYDLESRPNPLMDMEALRVAMADATATAALIPTATPTMTPTPTLTPTPTPTLEGTAEVTVDPSLVTPTATITPTITPTAIPDDLTEAEAQFVILPLTAGDFRLQRTTQPPSLLEQCMLSIYYEEIESDCSATVEALYVGMNTYRDEDGKMVGLVIAQFETQEQASQALLDMFRYSRLIGRVGNYAMLSSRSVGYFYSSTRERFSFSWSNGPWLYIASGTDFKSMEALVKEFPY